MRRRHQPSDKLDAALDGRPVKVDDELAPLVETAAKLRAALEAIELDPQAAERHLGMVLDGQATVLPLPTPPRPQAGRRPLSFTHACVTCRSLRRRREEAGGRPGFLTVVGG
jgi:hypothetical protein